MRTSALLGRSTESTLLDEATGLPDHPGGLVVLSGEAGIGKTRLVADLGRRARASGWLVVTGHCVGQSGTSLPYLPFVEILTTLRAEIPEVVASVVAHHPALERLDPAREASGQAASPAAIAEAVHALLTRIAEGRPVLVVIEDAHWSDHSSRDLITLLLARGFTGPVSLVVTYRSDDLHRGHPLHATLPVWARTSATRLDLGPLAERPMRHLIARLDPSADAEAIAARAEGNPFFAEELVASGSELGDDLSRVLRRRFEELGPDARSVARAVAVGGRRVPHALLEQVVGLEPDALDEALRAAIEHHTLILAPPDAYAFRHALLAEAVAADLLPGERGRLHKRYAAALAGASGLGASSELSRHAAAAGDLATAVTAGLQAAAEAMRRGGPREALDLYESVLGWLGDGDPAADDVTVSAAQAAAASGDIERAVHLITDRLDDDIAPSGIGRARLLAALVVHDRLRAPSADHIAIARESVDLTAGLDGPERLEALTALVQAYVDQERWSEAAAVGDRALVLAESARSSDALTDLRTILSRVFEIGRDSEATDSHLREIIAQSVDGPAKVRALHRLGDREQESGLLHTAMLHFDEAAAVGRRSGRVWGPFEILSVMRGALIAYELGDFAAAQAKLDAVGERGPQPLRSVLDATRLLIEFARDDTVDEARFERTTGWWGRETMVAVLGFQPGVLARAAQGRTEEAIALIERARAVIETRWDPTDAVLVRIAAVLVGVLADAAPTTVAARERYRALADDYVAVAREAVPWGGRPMGPEGRAWQARLRAERMRLERACGGPVDAAAHVAAWREAVTAFEVFGHVFEAGRTRARLARALAEAGDAGGAREAAAEVRAVAEALPSAHLLAMIGAVAAPGVVEADLTPREREVLALVAQGYTNGQIGRELFIAAKTASVHVSSILAKLGAANRAEAASLARERGLLG